jgi:hypothetical protein
MSSSLIGGKLQCFRVLETVFRCVSDWQFFLLPERLTMEVTCYILSFLVISTGIFVSFTVSNTRRHPSVRAVSSSEGIQESAEVCGVGINDSGRKSFEVSRSFGHTDVIVRYVGVRLWIK